MEWSTVVFLGTAIISGVLFMGILIFGVKKTSEFKAQEKILDKKAKNLESDSRELWEVLKRSEEEKMQILDRLQNLEAIVTSEAYEAIQSGEDEETVKLHLDEEETKDLNDSDKAAKIAKRVR